MFNAITPIIIIWCVFWYIGQRQKGIDWNKKMFEMAEKAKGQWD